MSNLILMSDAYKASHYQQYPENSKIVTSYIEPRGGRFPEVFFDGLHYFLLEYLSKPITQEDIEEAAKIHEGMLIPFNREGWEYIVNELEGYLPIVIEAVPEGTLVPVKNALVKVYNTDDKVPWITSYMESALLRAVWYPSTISTISFRIKRVVKAFNEITSDLPLNPCSLNDFGLRGVSSKESSLIGGMAHLKHFQGTDNMEAVAGIFKYYSGKDGVGYSIPASEHATITSWGRDREFDAYKNIIDKYLKEGCIVACVSDSYDVVKATREGWCKQFKEQIENSGGTLVIRPDSGDPVKIMMQLFEIVEEHYGVSLNSKGYKVFPDCIRFIQGDGVDEIAINNMLFELAEAKFSSENLVFGMGGALLQTCDRDTMKWAMKCCNILVEKNGMIEQTPVYKDPITDPGKRSKMGNFTTVRRIDNTIATVALDTSCKGYPMIRQDDVDLMRPVYSNGRIIEWPEISVIRALSESQL